MRYQDLLMLDVMRHAGRFVASVSAVTLFAYCFVFFSPSVHAVIDHTQQADNTEMRLVEELGTINQQLEQATIALQSALTSSTSAPNKVARIRDFISQQRNRLNAQYESIEAWLAKAPHQSDQQILSNYRQLLEALSALEKSDVTQLQASTSRLLAQLKQVNRGAPVHTYDNDNLPFGPSQAEPIAAALDLQALSKVSGVPAKGPLSADQDRPGDADLLPSVDAQLTEALQQKAAELGYDPLAIYSWVYNNIDYIPSFGSMQGADYTLLNGRGNAFDTSSLLISLLRASNVPARYVFGTAEFSKAQLQNWVGGVDTWEAAANLLGQGSIPVTVIKHGNGQETVAIEHAWVEAWIDDRWVALDAAFKEYSYSKRLVIEEAVPFESILLKQQLENAPERNEAEGWVRGLDIPDISSEIEKYQTQLEQYININHPDATIDDLLGTKKIIEYKSDTLPLNLPYLSILAQQSVSSIPNNLRLQYRFVLNDEWGSELLSYTATGPELVGKRHALSYSPATNEDMKRLFSIVPEEVNDLSELPSSLPIGFVKVVPEWIVDGETVQIASAVGIGNELMIQQGFFLPRRGWDMGLKSPTIAGAYQAVGVEIQGMAVKDLKILEDELNAVQTSISNNSNLNLLSRHDTIGLMLQTGILSYFGLTHAKESIAARVADAVYYRQPSYGTFGIAGQVSYWFGIPRTVAFSSVVMDIDRLAFSSEVGSNCYGEWVDLNRAASSRASAMEHMIPEMMFNVDPNKRLEGVSSVKVLNVATQRNQKIYVLNLDKIDSLNDISIDNAARNEIRDALYKGNRVIVHEKPIDYFGWQGSGYIIENVETGSGAYKISGGSNGGELANSLMTFSAFLLGAVDGYTAHAAAVPDAWFSSTLKALQSAAKFSQFAGIFGLAAGLLGAYLSGAQGWDLVGQVIVSVVSFIITMVVVSAIAAALGPIGGFIFGGIAAAAIAALSNWINGTFFSRRQTRYTDCLIS